MANGGGEINSLLNQTFLSLQATRTSPASREMLEAKQAMIQKIKFQELQEFVKTDQVLPSEDILLPILLESLWYFEIVP